MKPHLMRYYDDTGVRKYLRAGIETVRLMDARPIGVFDSGLGGLTTVKKLTELMPGEDIIYLGDTGRVPYGSRSRETILKYARQDTAFLMNRDIKALVIACNTVCSSVSPADLSDYTRGIPVYEVVSAPAAAAARLTKNGKIGVIGTKATIRSGAYEAALTQLSPGLQVRSASCPLFVPLVEDGVTSVDDIAVMAIAERYLADLRDSGVDTLLLGCTHYPLLKGVISKVMGPGVALIDSGAETAKLVSDNLAARMMLSPASATASLRFYVTDGVEGFETLASMFLESDVNGRVEQVALE